MHENFNYTRCLTGINAILPVFQYFSNCRTNNNNNNRTNCYNTYMRNFIIFHSEKYKTESQAQNYPSDVRLDSG